MKLWNLFRICLAEKLLSLALRIAPKDKEGKRLAKHLFSYAKEAMAKINS